MSDERNPLTEHHLAARLVVAQPSVGPVNLARKARWQWYSDLEATSGQALRPGPGSAAVGRSTPPRAALHVPDRGDLEVRSRHGLPAANQLAQYRTVPAPAAHGGAGLWPDRPHPVVPDVLP